MISIDTIKFKLGFGTHSLYQLDYSKRDYKDYLIQTDHYAKYKSRIKVCHKKYRNKEKKKGIYFLTLKINKERFDDGYDHYNVYIDLYMNNFIYQSFNEYEVDKTKIFKKLYDLLREILDIEEFDDTERITITDIDVAKDVMLNHNPKYYLDILRHRDFPRYYPVYNNTGNKTITVYQKGELKKLTPDTGKPKQKVTIYNKTKKFKDQDKDVRDLNILRFEYSFFDDHRRDIGIKKKSFPLSKIYDLGWSEILKKYLFDKYLDDHTDKVKEDFIGRQDESQIEAHTIDGKSKKPLEVYRLEKLMAALTENADNPTYSYKRPRAVLFKERLKDELSEINSTGLELYNELYKKAYELDDFGSKIPNVNQIYLN